MRFLDDRGRWLSWWDGRVRSLLFDLVVALLCSVGLVEVASASPLVICALVGAGMGILVRRRFPAAAVVGGLAVLGATSAPLPASIALYTFARRRGPCLALWCAGILTVPYQVTVEIIDQSAEWAALTTSLAIAVKSAFYSVPLLLGLWLYQRHVTVVAARERIERAERERELLAEREVTNERRRIAREMHDVVAHRASVMTLQAGALTVRAQDERTSETAEIIRQNSAKALTELRGMLHVLRDSSSAAGQHSDDHASAPTVRAIESLVRDATEAGSTVDLQMPDVLPEISDAIGRAAYRVVQEALTNTAKHAPHAAVRIDVEVAGDDLVLTISNDRGRPADAVAVSGSGHGLLGMRERVAFTGGSLEAGPTGSSAYRVRAVLPLRASESPEQDSVALRSRT